MKWDPRWSLYGGIILGGLYVGLLDVNSIHRMYELDQDTQLTMYLHGIVISYMIQGLFFYERSDIMAHFISLVIIAAMWMYNRNCILTIMVKNKVQYTEDDYNKVIGKYPNRMIAVFRMIIPMLLIDSIKLLYVK